MIAVGIDVSKSKSTVAILNADGSKRITPFDVKHNLPELNALVKYLNDLNENIVILMEHTGHYHYPILKKLNDEGFQVCLVNPYQMKKYGDTELRRTKTDKKDASLIALYLSEKKYITYPKQSYHISSLKSLTRARDSLVRERSLMLVKMTNVLDKIFPEFKPFFNEYALELSLSNQFFIFKPTLYSPMPLATTIQDSPAFR